MIGRTLPGYAADKIGNFNVSFCAACISTILVFALWLPSHSSTTLIVYVSLFGLSSGSYTAMNPTLMAQISDIREIGLRTGSMYGLISIAALTGSPIGGALITTGEGSYWRLQLLTGSLLAMGSILYLCARMYLAKGRLWAKV